MPQGIGSSGGNGPHQVVDFNEARTQRLDEKRRKTERIFFKQLLGVYCITENSEMRPIEIVDVSEDGCAFQVPFDAKSPWPSNVTDDLTIRLYFSQDTYLPITLKIQNSRPYIEDGAKYNRFGCLVDQTLTSFAAYQQFVKFLKLYSEHAHKDEGNATLFYL